MAKDDHWLGDQPTRGSVETRGPAEHLEPLLTVEVLHLSKRTVQVAFAGELDIASAPQARQVLGVAGTMGFAEIELDLRALAFCRARVAVDRLADLTDRFGVRRGRSHKPRLRSGL